MIDRTSSIIMSVSFTIGVALLFMLQAIRRQRQPKKAPSTMQEEWEIDEAIFDNVMALITATINEIEIGTLLEDMTASRDTAVLSLAVATAIIHSLVANMIEDETTQTVQTVWAQIAAHVAASRNGLVPPTN